MRIPRRAPRGVVFTALAISAALLIAACGGSSSSGSTTSTTKNASSTTTTSGSTTTAGKTATAAETAFRVCLKQHGVTLPSGGFGRRPGGGTGTFTRPSGTGTFTRPSGNSPPGGGFAGGGGFGGGGNSKFATAFKDCASKLPKGAGFGRFGGGGFGAGAPGRGGAGRAQFSTKTLTSYVACIRKHGYTAMPNPNTSGTGPTFPASVESNAKFQAANKSCESILTSAFRPPAGAAGGSGTATTSST